MTAVRPARWRASDTQRLHLVRNDRGLCGTTADTWTRRTRHIAVCAFCQQYPPDAVTHHDLTATGLSYRQIDYWTHAGWLRPFNPDPGTGVTRVYPASELPIADKMARLVAAGIAPAVAHDIARHGRTEIGPGIHVQVEAA